MKIEFKPTGKEWGALNNAAKWLVENGYSYGSLCGDLPVAIMYGEYTLPQKWKNMNATERNMADGFMQGDWRNGKVTVTLFTKVIPLKKISKP